MKSSYKIYWTNHALKELKEVFKFLQSNWTEKELRNLAIEIEKTLELISINPELFPKTRKNKNTIEIVSFFSNSKNPNKLKLQ